VSNLFGTNPAHRHDPVGRWCRWPLGSGDECYRKYRRKQSRDDRDQRRKRVPRNSEGLLGLQTWWGHQGSAPLPPDQHSVGRRALGRYFANFAKPSGQF